MAKRYTAAEKADRAKRLAARRAENAAAIAKVMADIELAKQPYERPPIDVLKEAMRPPVTIR